MLISPSLQLLLRESMERQASDLHLMAGLPPSLRVDGEIEFLQYDPLPADDLREAALQNYVSSTSWQFPESSAAYAPALSDENRRHNAIRDAARNWLRNDPAAATKWLNSTDLPDERKKELIAQASQNR